MILEYQNYWINKSIICLNVKQILPDTWTLIQAACSQVLTRGTLPQRWQKLDGMTDLKTNDDKMLICTFPFPQYEKIQNMHAPTDAWWCVTLNNSSRRHKCKTKQMKKASTGKRLHFLCQEPLWLALCAQHLWNIPAELCGLFTLDPSQYHLTSGHQDTPILSFSLKVFCYLIPGRGSS